MGDVMDSTLMHFNKGRTGENTNGASLDPSILLRLYSSLVTSCRIERFFFSGKWGIQLKSDIHSPFLVYKLEYQPVSMESLWLRNRSFGNVIL